MTKYEKKASFFFFFFLQCWPNRSFARVARKKNPKKNQTLLTTRFARCTTSRSRSHDISRASLGNWHTRRPSTAQPATKFDKRGKKKKSLLSTLANDWGQLQWILILPRRRTLRASECLVMPRGRKLICPNANFVWIASFNRLQKWVWGKRK